ncbi:MAG TPA: hypothetical protein VF074_06340, partial [Pyrinomonadaceae bacterium]
ALILSVTGLADFLTSYILLSFGVLRMSLRYPAAILVSYLVFLVLLAFWLWLQRRSFDLELEVPTDVLEGSASAHEDGGYGGGGDFGGAGSGESWQSSVASPSSGGSSGGSDSLSGMLDVDLDDGWLVVIAIVAIVGGLIASFYVIYIAPALLAEILVDGALIAGLYKRVKPIEERHWLRAAVRKTIVPALLVTVLFTVGGYSLEKAIPKAHTIGEAWKYVSS